MLLAGAAAMAPVVMAVLVAVTVPAVIAHDGDVEPAHDGSLLTNSLIIDWRFYRWMARGRRRCRSRFALLQEIVRTRNLNATWRAAAGDEEIVRCKFPSLTLK